MPYGYKYLAGDGHLDFHLAFFLDSCLDVAEVGEETVPGS